MGQTAFYPFLSGRDNLRAVARPCGIGDDRVYVVLGQAGLLERAGNAVSGYSYGMRQRRVFLELTGGRRGRRAQPAGKTAG